MDFIDEENRAGLLLHFSQHRFQTLLEIAAVLGAGDERTHVERVNRGVEQHVGHLVLDDHASQAFRDRRLADTGLAYVQRIIFTPAAQNLYGALDLELASDQRIDLALARRLIQIRRIFLQGIAAAIPFALGVGGGRAIIPFAALLAPGLGQAVRDEIDDIEARHVLHAQQVGRMRLFFTEDRHQHIGHGDFFLAARLHVKHGALQDPLKPQRGLHVPVLARRHARRGLVDKLFQFGLELGGICTTRLQDLPDFGRIHDREQQMLDGHEFMPRLARAGKRIVQTKFQFLT